MCYYFNGESWVNDDYSVSKVVFCSEASAFRKAYLWLILSSFVELDGDNLAII
jgi:hypothetical protein